MLFFVNLQDQELAVGLPASRESPAAFVGRHPVAALRAVLVRDQKLAAGLPAPPAGEFPEACLDSQVEVLFRAVWVALWDQRLADGLPAPSGSPEACLGRHRAACEMLGWDAWKWKAVGFRTKL